MNDDYFNYLILLFKYMPTQLIIRYLHGISLLIFSDRNYSYAWMIVYCSHLYDQYSILLLLSARFYRYKYHHQIYIF